MKRDRQLFDKRKDEERVFVKEKKTKNIIDKMTSIYNGTQLARPSTAIAKPQQQQQQQPKPKNLINSATNTRGGTPSGQLEKANLEKMKKQFDFKIKSSSSIKSGLEGKSRDSHLEIESEERKSSNPFEIKEEKNPESKGDNETKKVDKKSSFKDSINPKEEKDSSKAFGIDETEQEEFGVVNHEIEFNPLSKF